MSSILLIDDDVQVVDVIGRFFARRGWAVVRAGDGAAGIASYLREQPDLVLLDLGLPDLSGVDVLRRIRKHSQVPVIVLSARHGSDDKVEALDVGADDYVTKPFGMDELLARVRAAVRRAVPDQPPAPVVTDAFTVDLATTRVLRDGEEVRLTPTEWRLLEALVTRPGRLVPQRQLLAEVWGPGYAVETNYLRVYVAGLRRKLETDPSRPRHLLTEPGMGYRFVA